ncbi:TPA: aminotransferase class III-fold pyridoxal phosphate-dependent enzyme, partial [Klebsiella pneumoniae]|nr:aminotransferase class III-fold pyridoxal phosphate-dependent enzyme [Klebsiella pneumoniae]
DQGDVACVIVEPILSDGGMVVPPKGFLGGLHRLCVKAGVPLICDEVKMGLGRPGLMHAFQHENIVPEIVTFGKVLGGGLPLSATVGPKEILGGPAAHALLTTAGNPICTAVGRSV